MGKKTKVQSNGIHKDMPVKRKNILTEEPPAKRKKKNQQSYPGQFVLLKPPEENDSEQCESEMNESFENVPQPTTSLNGKKNKHKNGKSKEMPTKLNGNHKDASERMTKILKKLEVMRNNDEMSDDDDEWMSGELETDSMSDEEDESCSEEWSTDTDYTGDEYSISDSDQHSFHESDCEMVDSEDSSEDNGDYFSDDDSDYVPDVEDKYVKRGEAIMYDAKGLDLAFGNSTESKIIEITDICPAMEEVEGEEIPKLVDENGKIHEEPVGIQETPAEVLIDNFHLDDDDDIPIASSLLLNRAVFHTSTDDESVTLQLRGTIHFHGVLIIRPLVNKVQINGYTLDEGETMTVTSISKADYFLNLSPVIESGKAQVSEEIRGKFPSFDASKESLVHLQQGIPGTALEMLKSYSVHPLLPSKKMLTTNSPCQTAEIQLAAKFFVAEENQKLDAYAVNEDWKYIEIKADSRVVVTGGKNVGKSSLSQFLINQNLKKFKKILLIDLDIGQPICGAAQTVSATMVTSPIIGPGYFSENSPEFSLFYGDKNVMTSPFKYVRCVRRLVEFCEQFQGIPWVINTMGYQKGFGLQLMCLLLKIVQPTDVIQIQHRVKSLNFQEILIENLVNSWKFTLFDASDLAGISETASYTTHVLDSIVNNKGDSRNWVSNSTEKRKLSMLAHLSKLLPGRVKSINDVTPFRAPIAKLQMLVVDEEFSQKFSIDLLNGNLVYLCHSSDSLNLNSDSILECFGVGIVRGVDKIHGQIYLLMPRSSSQALQAKVNVLGIGNIPLPAEVILKQSYNVTGNVPHVTFFKDRNAGSQKYINKKGIKDCF